MEDADRNVLEFIGDEGKTAEQVVDRVPVRCRGPRKSRTSSAASDYAVARAPRPPTRRSTCSRLAEQSNRSRSAHAPRGLSEPVWTEQRRETLPITRCSFGWGRVGATRSTEIGRDRRRAGSDRTRISALFVSAGLGLSGLGAELRICERRFDSYSGSGHLRSPFCAIASTKDALSGIFAGIHLASRRCGDTIGSSEICAA
jgi:hypothetical protein